LAGRPTALRASERANTDDSAADHPANLLGCLGSSAPVPSTVADCGRGVIARNQRIIPISSTAAEVNSIRGKRSISGYPQLIAMSFSPPNVEPCNMK
jgi:hypothetical protein